MIISVANKEGLQDFARELSGLGWEIISTGGTARLLRGAGLQVREVEDVTNSPEILGGRVKTLHPVVHGGILARRNNPEDMAQIKEMGIAPVDMVVCNLYPFVETARRPSATIEDVIEEIDIGGVTLLRASAKNWESVVVIASPRRYKEVIEQLKTKGDVDRDTRRELALEVFNHTASYDSAIAAYLGGLWKDWPLDFPDELSFGYKKVLSLRYGENPHQKAAFYEPIMSAQGSPISSRPGKGVSYNNINDADAAFSAVWDLPAPACVIVKHAGPCGVALGATAQEAFENALAADPVSAFGGVVAFNCDVDEDCALAMKKLFMEVLIAPSYSVEALSVLGAKKDLRIMAASMDSATNKTGKAFPRYSVKQALGGLLVQEVDTLLPKDEEWRVVSKRAPTDQEIRDLRLAMVVAKHVRSNAIVLAKDGATVGIGGGQPNRVDCVKIAVERGKDNVRGSSMASDAFFPFPDSIEEAAKAGVSAVAHPGGSKKDAETLAVADANGMALVITGARHFRH